MNIAENYRNLRKEIPSNVSIVVACKTRTPEEIIEAIDAGAENLGENYVQEAEKIREALGDKAKQVKWHMIGNLQKNKINRALKIFDVVQTIDSGETAVALNERAQRLGKVVPVFIELNLANEETKSGIRAEYEIVEALVREVSQLKCLHLEGLMAMEPFLDNPETSRPYFQKAKDFFEKIKTLNLPNIDMKVLSMGMSHSYKIAIEEGSNMVRLGSVIFKK